MHEGTREERVNLRTSAIDARGCVTPRDICCKEAFLSALKIIRSVCLKNADVSLVCEKIKKEKTAKTQEGKEGGKHVSQNDDVLMCLRTII